VTLLSRLTIFALAALSVNAAKAPTVDIPNVTTGVVWQERGDASGLDLLDGPGGKDNQPQGPFKFLNEDKEGTSPKFDVVDAKGNRWRVKLGEESQAETAATRLMWAAGYYADFDYYQPELRVEGMEKLHRGEKFVTPDGVIHGARLELKPKGQKKAGNWDWFNNPFVGTQELDGLRVMMALVNNWDLKTVNNSIYRRKNGEILYVVSDVGASFGKTGNPATRSKNDFRDYYHSPFIEKETPEKVDFSMKSRPLAIEMVDPANYAKRTHIEGVTKNIPRAHAKWLGQRLAQLSDEQITNCFRAAGYGPDDAGILAGVVRGRINALAGL
jgi:hypothetical protein